LISVLLVSGLLAYQNARQLRTDAAWVIHTHEELEALQGALGAITDAETGQRGFLLTNDERYLEPYQAGLNRAQARIRQLGELVRDNPRQQARVLVVASLISAKSRELEQTIALQRRDPPAARQLVLSHLGRSIMGSIRAEVAVMEQEERTLLAGRERTTRRGYRTVIISGAVFGLLSLGLAAALLVQLRRHFRQRDQFERTLGESEERFRTVFERGGIPMAITALDGRMLRVNPAFGQLLGLSETELTGRAVWDITLAEDREQTRAGLQRVARGEVSGFQVEKRYLHRDGTVIWGDVCTACVTDLTGRPLYLVTHVQDITERKRAEAGLRQANQRKDEFLATLAHELRNPLAPIRTGAFLLSQRATPDPELKQLYAMITRQAAHMARLVDDLLDVSRIERGRVELRKERVELGLVLAHALEASKALIEAGGHQVTVDLPDPAPEMEADPVRLEQMLCNLLNNACKYTPAGGRIQVSAAREGALVVLRVRDNGMGMTPEVIAHIFELFYQANQTGDRRGGGLGIGLTLVQRLAQMHGGALAATSDGPGKGSEFVLTLPALEPAPARERKQVLIVDDDRNVRQTLELLLHAMDYQVSAAATGARGIELALAQRPDIALIDLGMPGLDGLEVATRIRAELGQAIRLVALTGFGGDADVAGTKAAGFDHHLVKSGDPRELLQLLEAIG
jgi:PAS domain S-box-containing protein